MRTVVLVGAGMAGASAAEALRGEGWEGRIVLVGAEPHLPYERPPLSKEYLRGEQAREALSPRPEAWYREHDVEPLLGNPAVALDPAARVLELAGGGRLGYDRLLLATGGRPRTIGGEPTEHVLVLRTVDDADRIRPHLRPGRRIVVVGAGFIGTEVAATARGLGAEVTLVDLFPVPLARALGEELGAVVEAVHRDHGVDLRLGSAVHAVEEREGGVVVRTEAGEAIEGDVAVVGVAIRPNDELARAAALDVDDGVVVDDRCRTSVPDVFAAGDVARHRHPLYGRHVRVEHFDNALKQGAAAARAMLGADASYAEPHWFWSDQHDLNIQMAGLPEGADRTVVRGSVADRAFVTFFLRGGVLIAAAGFNRGRDVRRALRLIAARATPDPDRLADEDVDLRRLAPAAR